ncbi:MAG: DUF1003 domain-containing protein [Bacteroidia bacterium]|nr:DUF1003 domain-containing protein [Bacteroidia bacterium]
MALENTFYSDLSGQEFPLSERISGHSLRRSILQLIQKEKPGFSEENYISLTELNRYRERYISDYLVRDMGELTELEETVLNSLGDKTTLTDKVEEDSGPPLTLGQQVADRVAAFGGSWTFMISFAAFILVWVLINIFWFANQGFDPYPFILLNLILSCLASVQAPIIMMSQNRQEEKDRERAKKDYMVNLKSELEIRILHEKLDHLIMHQQQELLEIQKVQIEMMNDILQRVGDK